MPRPGGFGASRLVVEIESEVVGSVLSAEGGEAYADVVSEPGGVEGHARSTWAPFPTQI